MINPAHNESTRFRSLIGAAIIILLMTSSALAQDKTPSEVPTKDAKERPIVDTRGCDLSPAEQIVVTQLRKAIENVETIKWAAQCYGFTSFRVWVSKSMGASAD